MAPAVEPRTPELVGGTSARWRLFDRLISRPVVGAAVLVRIAAAAILGFGPWTDQGSELQGWDVERFVAIARAPGRAWRDVAVEYPPGAVIVFEVIDRLTPSGVDAVVGAHRWLLVVTLAADLLLAAMLRRRAAPAGAWYLVLGLPLVPMGLVRLDIVVTLLATAAVLVAVGPDRAPGRPTPSNLRLIAAGALTVAAAMVKVWPGLLIPALWAVRRDRTAGAAALACAAGLGLWLFWADAGLDPVRQVADLRGATGWQLESIGGVLTSLADGAGLVTLDPGEGPRMELNAFRTGTVSPVVVTGLRVVAVVATIALAIKGRRVARFSSRSRTGDDLPVIGAVMLGSTAALLVTSPLLSPQFLIWLTPWAALVATRSGGRLNAPLSMTLGAATITGLTLALFGPPDLAQPAPALALAVRNGLLLWLPISCWRWLDRIDRGSAD